MRRAAFFELRFGEERVRLRFRAALLRSAVFVDPSLDRGAAGRHYGSGGLARNSGLST